MSGWTLLGFAVAAGLPLAVLIGALFWPVREDDEPSDETEESKRPSQ